MFNKARSVALTGHRVLEKTFDKKKIEDIFNKLIEKGFDTFLVGMALGFDTVCFHILEEIRKQKSIKIIACIPCLTQAERFNLSQKKEYDKMVQSADEKVVLSKEYTRTCMQKRNEFMVDNCSVLVSYLKRDFGGTKNTVDYARKNSVPIIML